MKPQRRRLRKSEWVTLFLSVVLLAIVASLDKRKAQQPPTSPVQSKGFVEFKEKVGAAKAMSFSPDGALLAVGDEGVIRGSFGKNAVYDAFPPKLSVWNVKRRQQVWSVPFKDSFGNSFKCWPTFSPDGTLLAVTNFENYHAANVKNWRSGGFVHIYQAKTGQLLRRLPVGELTIGRWGEFFHFLPDNRHMWVEGNPPKLWDLRKPKTAPVVMQSAEGKSYSHIAPSKDGRFIAIPIGKRINQVFGGVIQIYDVKLRRRIGSIPSKPVARLHFSPDNKSLIVFQASSNQVSSSRQCELVVWDWRRNHQSRRVAIDDIYDVCLSPDEQSFAFIEWVFAKNKMTYTGKISSMEKQGLKKLWSQTMAAAPIIIHFSSVGGYLVDWEQSIGTTPEKIVVRSVKNGKTWREFHGESLGIPSPDGKTLATASGNTVKLWDVSDLTQKPR